jgi:small subunit ribosomal protein S10
MAKKAEDAAEKKEKKAAKKADAGRIRVIIRAFDHKVVDESAKTIIDTAERSGAIVVGPIPLPTKKERFTVLRSTFVNKDAREQFELRTHKRLLDITDSSSNTITQLSSLNLPSGVDVEIKMS